MTIRKILVCAALAVLAGCSSQQKQEWQQGLNDYEQSPGLWGPEEDPTTVSTQTTGYESDWSTPSEMRQQRELSQVYAIPNQGGTEW